MAVMATSLCMVMSGSLGTPLSQPTGCNQGISWMFYLTLPQTTTPGCWARQDKGGWTSQSAFWFWPPVPGSNHLLLIDWLWLQIFDWLEHRSKPPPTVCLFARHKQPLGSGSCSQCSRACSQKSFLADSWYPLAIISYSPCALSDYKMCFPLPSDTCSFWMQLQTHAGHTHRPGTLSTHRLGCACALLPHQWGLSDSPCPGNNDQQPPATTPRLHKAQTQGWAGQCRQHLPAVSNVTIFPHLST